MTDFVLVPGAGGDARYWHLVVERLAVAGHHAVAVDLPGPDPDVGLPGYAELVREAIAAAPSNPVVVGQSLGAFSATWAAAQEGASELILLNAMIPAPHESAGQWWSATGHEADRRASEVAAGRDPDAPFDAHEQFLHDVPLEALAGAGEGRDESDAVFAEPWALDEWPAIPTRVVAGRDDRFFPLKFQERVAWQRLGQDVEVITGGHLVALSQPEALVGRLLDQMPR